MILTEYEKKLVADFEKRAVGACDPNDNIGDHYACPCREAFYANEAIRMIRQFQKIQKRIAGEQFATPDLLDEINEMCRDGIAPKDNQ